MKNQHVIEKMKTECQKYLSFLKENKNADNKVISFMSYDIESKDSILQVFDEIQNDIMRNFFGDDYYSNAYNVGEIGDTYEETCEIRNDFEIEAINFIKG